MIGDFKSNEEILDFACKLRDALAKKGKAKEAQELSEVVDSYWTSTSELLGELLISLERVRNTVMSNFPDSTIKELDSAIQQIKQAFDQANNPS